MYIWFCDDDDDPLSPNSPRPSLTLADSKGNSPYTLPCAYDDAFDYTKHLADITDKIERMKQCWPLPAEMTTLQLPTVNPLQSSQTTPTTCSKHLAVLTKKIE